MAGYSVTYSVVDEATAKIAAINRQIQQLRAPIERQAKAMQQFVDVSGLRKVAEGFTEIARSAGDAFSSMSRLVPIIGGLTGAASIGGMVALVKTFTDLGTALERNADYIGTTTEQLDQWQNATKLAGGSVDNLIGSMKGLARARADAFTGADPAAAAWFAVNNIALKDMNGNLRSTADLLPEVLDSIDKHTDAQSRETAAIRFGSRALYELDEDFRRSGKTRAEWMRDAERQGHILDPVQLQRYREAVGALDVAFSGLGTEITGVMAQALTPLIKEFAEWVHTHQPQIIDGVNKIADAFRWMGEHMDTIKTTAEVIATIFATKWAIGIVGSIAQVVTSITGLTAALGAAPSAVGAAGALGPLAAGAGLAGAALATAFGLKWGLDKIFGPGPAGARASSRGGYVPGGIKPPAPAVTPPAPTFIPGARGGVRVSPAAGAAPAEFKAAIEAQESRGGYNNAPVPGNSAIGPRQMEPGTFAQWAKPGERIDNPDDNRRVSDRLIDHLWTQYGGDPRAVAAAYNGGGTPGYAENVMRRYTALGGGAATSPAGGAGAYGVPGAVMNYGATGALGPPGSNLTQITDPQGHKVTVNKAAADAFSGFLKELEGTGYNVTSLGGFADRTKRGGSGLSEHAFGAAIDINPSANAMGGSGTDMPANVKAMAAKYGLIWGGDWKGKTYDPMHFQWGGSRPWEAQGAPAQVTGGAPIKGAVDVTITHRNPPPTAGVAATATGAVNLRGPRTEQQQFGTA